MSKEEDTRRRSSITGLGTGEQKEKTDLGTKAENVGVPVSMLKGTKSKRKFTVTQTDLVHTSPMMKLAASLKKSQTNKMSLEKQMKHIQVRKF